jgi:phosphatidylserine/phosphatidylglycerophosphate/cardiolipin synthase-like enzyme/uncharacterized membrane protein YdjX (TVP38/TMEM64 family)
MTPHPGRPASSAASDDEAQIARVGHNCWQQPLAARAAVLVDAERYYAALAASLTGARHSVLVLGWDFHEATPLVRGEAEDRTIGALLNDLVTRRPELRVHVLDWDFAVVFATERQLFAQFRRWWRRSGRIDFRYDDTHPATGSHHQKIVVIDDSIAFCGGLDVTARRWDTRAHMPDDERRVDPWGHPYGPFHDVQMMVDGAAAAALGALARTRWRRATGERLRAVPERARGDRWPRQVGVDFQDVPVAIARTEPAFDGEPGVREVERLYVDGIAAARRVLYLENQYLTSHAIADALARRLGADDPLEVVLLGPLELGGWVEEHVLGSMRSRVLARLRALPGGARLGALAPVVGRERTPVAMHGKVMIVDDRFLRVGSSNANNRSMRLDTECDLAIEVRDGAMRRRIEAVRDGLIAEHLGVAAERLAAERQRCGSLLRAIAALQGGERTLVPIETTEPTLLDSVLGSSMPIDVEEAMDPERVLETFGLDRTSARAGWGLVSNALAVSALALAWRFGPLPAWSSWLAASAAGPCVGMAAIAVGRVLMLPITVLVVAAALIFGPWSGFAVALAGAVAGGLLGYGLGTRLGAETVARIAGGRQLRAVGRRLAKPGIAAVALVRVVPLAPFAVVNLIAAAKRVPVRHFAVGTLLGMGPGTLALAVLADRVAAGHVGQAAAVLLCALIGVVASARWWRSAA